MSTPNLFFFNAAGVALLSVLQHECLGELQAAAAQRSNGVIPVATIEGYKLNVINGLIRRDLLVESFRNDRLVGYRLNKRQEYKLLTRNHREGSRAWKMANGVPLEEAPVAEAPRKRRSKTEQAPAPVTETAPRRRRRAAAEQAAA